jgi:Arc/MetJ-type ribon-helix-helix transcriptional regulator
LKLLQLSRLTSWYDFWYYFIMNAAKITISIDHDLLKRLDLLVQNHVFPNRSQAVQAAVEEKIGRVKKTRLATECAKLNPKEEQAFADLGLAAEANDWPPY